MLSSALIILSASMSQLGGVPVVTDGDTIRIGEDRIRLEGIDAPESAQTCENAHRVSWQCGVSSTQALTALIGDKPVRCEISGKDRYNRSLGTCWLGDLDINGWMVNQGWAVAYRQYSTRYIPNENDARSNHRNIWSGTFEMPSQWRANHRR